MNDLLLSRKLRIFLHQSLINASFPPSETLCTLTFSVVISGGYSTVTVIAAEADSPMPLSAVQRYVPSTCLSTPSRVRLWPCEERMAPRYRSEGEEGNIQCQAGQRGATCPPGRWNMLHTVMTMGEKGRRVTDIWGKPSTVSIDGIAAKNKYFYPCSQVTNIRFNFFGGPLRRPHTFRWQRAGPRTARRLTL